MNETYAKLIELVDTAGASYDLIDHEPEGRTEIISPIRGHALEKAAKCMIVMVKVTKKKKYYILAVVPGDKRVDLDALKELKGGSYVSFAAKEMREQLAA